jgi:hypothetical protein
MRRLRSRPHACLHLPPLDGHQALLLVALCERLIAAVWRAHGEAMVDVKANDLPPLPFRPSPASPLEDGVPPDSDIDPF